MSNDNVVSLAAPAEIGDPLTDLLRVGARRLIESAVSAEFEEYLSAFEGERAGGRSPPGGAQRPPSRTADSDRDRRGGCAGAEGAQPLRDAGTVPFFAGAAVRASQRERGRGGSVVVPARGVDWQDASGRGGFGWRGGGPRAVGERGEPTEARLGRGVPGVVPAAARRRVGVPVGGRHPQRPAGRRRTPVRAGGDRRERPRRQTLPGHRGRRA